MEQQKKIPTWGDVQELLWKHLKSLSGGTGSTIDITTAANCMVRIGEAYSAERPIWQEKKEDGV